MSIIAIIEPLVLIGAIYFVSSYLWTTAQKPDGVKEIFRGENELSPQERELRSLPPKEEPEAERDDLI